MASALQVALKKLHDALNLGSQLLALRGRFLQTPFDRGS
jgi:hypothetical protein